jgi:DNA-binding transcriptional ArsR family regulator
VEKAKPRRVDGDLKRWKALSHPLRDQMLRHLSRHGPATSTTIGAVLGENTGTTSYHLRLLADAGVIEEVPERAHGRERWWRIIPTDLRGPDYGSLSAEEKTALDQWRSLQIPGELALVHRFLREHREYDGWAKAARAALYFTREGLESFMDDYLALLNRHGYLRDEAPPDARPMQLRMFYLPEAPAKIENRT